jgi:ATP-dependent protease ClpP protease subunit
MNINDLKNVVGEVKANEVAEIKFFGTITEESTRRFNEEFEFLEDCIRPSLIRVLINSDGGSVLHGMTTYSTISNSKIPTECIIEGIAASMGSVIWAAGEKSLMRDYSILMIHNPFLPDSNGEVSDMVKAFTKQIETIYRKRFGLKKDHVKSIMDGEAGRDGTFFDADSAVKAGIISADCVLKTSKQVCEKVKNELAGIEDMSKIQNIMCKINGEFDMSQFENKLSKTGDPNLNQNENPAKVGNLIKTTDTIMNEEKTIGFEFGAVAASLGLKDKFEVKDVMARISDLMSVEAKLDTANKALSDAQVVIAGKDAALQNLQKDLNEVNAELSGYKQKEEEAKQAKIESLVQNAIDEGKILETAKEEWVTMAKSNFELAQNTLNSIPVREKITEQIASDSANVADAVDASKTVEAKMAERVKAVVGENFEFKKLG